MAPIADEHGLTNPYREKGHKRHLKRGRPRKYLFGPPPRKRKMTKKEYALRLKFLIGVLCFWAIILLITAGALLIRYMLGYPIY